MNKWQKIGFAVGIGTATVTTAYILNKLVFSASVANGVTDVDNRLHYKWKFGDISYTKSGSGKPILLIHDLTTTSSTYEWKNIKKELSINHTVYAIDLLGCGYSDKPNITYTAYLYVQMLNDFITNVIGKRTDVVVTGASAPLVIMACYSNDTLYDKLILVNPESIGKAMQLPNKKSNLLRILLNSPIIGTMIYNICMSKSNLQNRFYNDIFYDASSLKSDIFNAYHENSHLYGSSAKHLFTSTQCRYTTASIGKAVSELNNCIYIIAGEKEYMSDAIIEDYIEINPAIEAITLNKSKHLPQLEVPHEFINQLNIFL